MESFDCDKFLEGTEARGDVLANVPKFADALRPQHVYPCLCAALGVCGAPKDPDYHAGFVSTLTARSAGSKTGGGAHKGVKVPHSCALGRHLEGVRCPKSELFSCVRWGTWIEGLQVAAGIRAREYYAVSLFRRTNTTDHVFGPRFEHFNREACYEPHKLRLFLETALVRPFWTTKGMRRASRHRDVAGHQA